MTIAAVRAAPFTPSFDTTVLLDANNPHTLTATATNNFGLPATATASFNTNNGTSAASRDFYVAANGNDSNPGTASAPWATPNHAVRCGDNLHLRAGTYTNPFRDVWGHVWSCPSPTGYYFANLICDGPYVQSCLFSNRAVGTSIMLINSNNWLVRGVTAVNAVMWGGCFGSETGVAYIAFVNVYAKNCGAGAGTNETDYVAYVGSLFYGGAGLGGQCFSNLSIFEPKNTDRQPGTHVFIGGSFFINASNSLNCTDGEGLIFDRWDVNHYTGRGVVEQSLFIGNCSEAFEVFGNTGQQIYFTHSTTWGNGHTCSQGSGGGSEIWLVSPGSGFCVTIDGVISVGAVASVGLWNGTTSPTSLFYTVHNSYYSNSKISNSYLWNTAAATSANAPMPKSCAMAGSKVITVSTNVCAIAARNGLILANGGSAQLKSTGELEAEAQKL